VGRIPSPETRIVFPADEVARLTGLAVDADEIGRILRSLGFTVVHQPGSNALDVTAPSWRPDIFGKADLVEEVVRIVGVDQIAPQPLPAPAEPLGMPVLTPLQRRTRQAKRALAASGLVEAVTWSFVSRREAELFGEGRPPIPLANPISSDLSDMRPSLLPGLIAAARRNAARGMSDIALFEVGQIFRGETENDQRVAAAAIRKGTATPRGEGRHWAGAALPASAYDAKADLMGLLASLGVATGGLQIVAGGTAAFHPGRSALLRFGPKTRVGAFGELHPRVLAALDVGGPIVGFEIILDELPPAKAKATKAKPRLDLPELMPLQRDFAFVVDRSVEAGDIVKAALGAERSLISDIVIFDVYVGQGVPEGKKSVGIAATIQPRDHTLTDAEIEVVAAKIVADVGKKTGATLRG
jgi:phenylalanyl-tRNA synthetase beta chain